MTRELLENYRKRTLQCLLLEDMEEVDRFTTAFALEPPGELRGQLAGICNCR